MTDPTDRDRAEAAANALMFEDHHVNGGMCRDCRTAINNDWDYSRARHRSDPECLWFGVARVIEHIIREARAEGRRAAFEEAAAKADAERDEYEALIAAGKGQWQRPGYVPDDMWTKFLAVAACSLRLGDAIRALAAKEQPSEPWPENSHEDGGEQP